MKLDYASHLSLPRKLVLTTFGEFVMAFSAKVKSAISSVFNGLEVLSLASDEANLFKEIFSESSNLDYSGISQPSSPFARILNYILYLQLPRWFSRS